MSDIKVKVWGGKDEGHKELREGFVKHYNVYNGFLLATQINNIK